MATLPTARLIDDYLDLLVGRDRPEALCLVRYRRPDGATRQRFYPNARRPAAVRAIQALSRRNDVYVGCAPRTDRTGEKHAVERVWCLWADIDTPTLALEQFALAPTLTIASGRPGGRHVYFALTEPLTGPDAEAANRRLALALDADPVCHDATRMLRPPGTINHKQAPGQPVRRLEQTSAIYPLPEILAQLPELPAPAHHRQVDLSRFTPAAGDELRRIPPPVYVAALTGLDVGPSGKVTCPFHEDRTPSLHVYPTPERGWYAYCCGRGGSIIDLAAAIWQIDPRGHGYHEIEQRLLASFRSACEGTVHDGVVTPEKGRLVDVIRRTITGRAGAVQRR